MWKGKRLIQNKRGVTQLNVAFVIIFIFIALGVLLPFVNSAFDTTNTTPSVANLESEVGTESGNLNAVSALDIALSVAKMFFWTFGDLPFWLDGIFIFFRIALVLILIQYIPFIGS